MYTEEVLMTLNQWKWTHDTHPLHLLHLALFSTQLDPIVGFNAIPHELDGSQASSLLASTLACIQKRSRLVPMVSVISF